MISSTKEQIEITIQLNQSIKEKIVLLDVIVEAQKSQLDACRHLYEQMKVLHDDVEATEKRIDNLTPPKGGERNFDSLLDSLRGISETSEENKGFFSRFASVFKMLSKAASGLALMGFSSLGNFFKGLYSIFKTLLSFTVDLGKILFNIVAALVKLVVTLYDKLIQMANEAFGGGGSSEYYAALQKLKEQYGALSQNTPSAIIGMSRKMKAIKNVGLSPFKIFGNRGVMIQEFLEGYATKMGPLFEFYANEFEVTEGALLGMIKGMGLSGEDVEGMSRVAISKGQALTDVFVENHKIVSKIARPFTEASKLIHRDIAKATRNMASFGGATKEAIGAAAAFARSIGLNINDLTGIMDSFKDFDTALETSTKYFENFGLKVDTYQMFEEQDLGTMLNHIRDGFKTAGVETTSLNRAYMSLLSSTSGLDDSVARQAFSLKNTSADFAEIKYKASQASDGTKTLDRSLYELKDDIEFKTFSGGGQQFEGFLDAWLKGIERAMLRNKDVRELLRNIWASLNIFFREGTRFFNTLVESFPGLVDFIQAVRRFFDPRRISHLFGGINDSFIALFKGIGSGAYTVNKFFDDVGKLLLDHFKGSIEIDDGRLFESLKEMFNATLLMLKSMIEAIGELLSHGIRFLASVIRGDFDISKELKEIFEDSLDGFDKAFQPVADAVEKMVQKIGFAIIELKEAFTKLFEKSDTYEAGMSLFSKAVKGIMLVKDKIVEVVDKISVIFNQYQDLVVGLIIPVYSAYSSALTAYTVILWGLIFQYWGRSAAFKMGRGKIPPKYQFKQGKVPTTIRSDSTVRMKEIFSSRKNARIIRGFISTNQITFSTEANEIFKKMSGYDVNNSFGKTERQLKWSKLTPQNLTAAEYRSLLGGKGAEIYNELQKRGAPPEVLKEWEPFREIRDVNVEQAVPKKSLGTRIMDKIRGTRVGRVAGRARDLYRSKSQQLKLKFENSRLARVINLFTSAFSALKAEIYAPFRAVASFANAKLGHIPGMRMLGSTLKAGAGLGVGFVAGMVLNYVLQSAMYDENGYPKFGPTTRWIVDNGLFALQTYFVVSSITGLFIEAGISLASIFSENARKISWAVQAGAKLGKFINQLRGIAPSDMEEARESLAESVSQTLFDGFKPSMIDSLTTLNDTKDKWITVDMKVAFDPFFKNSQLWNSVLSEWKKIINDPDEFVNEGQLKADFMFALNFKLQSKLLGPLRAILDEKNKILSDQIELGEAEEKNALLGEKQKLEKQKLIDKENENFDKTGVSSFFESFKKMMSKVFEIVTNLKNTISSYSGPISALNSHIGKNAINHDDLYSRIVDFQNIGTAFSNIISKEFEQKIKDLDGSNPPLAEKLGFVNSALSKASEIPGKTSFINADLKDGVVNIAGVTKNISHIIGLFFNIVGQFSDFEKNKFNRTLLSKSKKDVYAFQYSSIELSLVPNALKEFSKVIAESLKSLPTGIFSKTRTAAEWFESFKALFDLKSSFEKLSGLNFPAEVTKNDDAKPDDQVDLDFSIFNLLDEYLRKVSAIADLGWVSFNESITGAKSIFGKDSQFSTSISQYEGGIKRLSKIVELSEWFKSNSKDIVTWHLDSFVDTTGVLKRWISGEVVGGFFVEVFELKFLNHFGKTVERYIDAYNETLDVIHRFFERNSFRISVELMTETEIFEGKSGSVKWDGEAVEIIANYTVTPMYTKKSLEDAIFLRQYGRVKDRIKYWSEEYPLHDRNGTVLYSLPPQFGYRFRGNGAYHQPTDFDTWGASISTPVSHENSAIEEDATYDSGIRSGSSVPGSSTNEEKDKDQVFAHRQNAKRLRKRANDPNTPDAERNRALEQARLQEEAADRLERGRGADRHQNKGEELPAPTRQKPEPPPPPPPPPPQSSPSVIDQGLKLPRAKQFKFGGS